MKYSYFFTLSFIALNYYNCAQIKPLEGGDKDITPPKIVNIIPKNKSTLFSSNVIIFTFNEFITAPELKTNIVISPPVEKFTEEVVGKKLIINIEGKLKPNLTYNINLNNCIEDVTEKNKVKKLIYSFSTSAQIDSSIFSGVVINAKNSNPLKDIIIGLYKISTDSVPYKSKPLYLAKSNKLGKFSFFNIKIGDYKIIAFNDKNKNLLYDNPIKDYIGFINKPIKIINNKDSLKTPIRLFINDTSLAFIKDQNYLSNHRLEITLSKAIKFFKLHSKNKKYILYTKNIKNNQYTVWLSTQTPDSTQLIIYNKNKPLDTLYFSKTKANKFKPTKTDSIFEVSYNLTKKKLKPDDSLEISINNPFKIINTKKIMLFADNKKINLDSSFFSKHYISNFKIPFNFYNTLYEYTNYRLLILPKALKNISQVKNDSITVNFSLEPENKYGQLIFKISSKKNKNYIFTLTEIPSKKIVLTKNFKQNTNFKSKLLLPKKYILKLIEDNDKNREWTSGNFENKKLPEKIILYKQPIEVNENFEKIILWTIN